MLADSAVIVQDIQPVLGRGDCRRFLEGLLTLLALPWGVGRDQRRGLFGNGDVWLRCVCSTQWKDGLVGVARTPFHLVSFSSGQTRRKNLDLKF